MKLHWNFIAPLSKIRKILPDGHHVSHPSRDNGRNISLDDLQVTVTFKAGDR